MENDGDIQNSHQVQTRVSCDLRNRRRDVHGCANGGEIVPLMKRSEQRNPCKIIDGLGHLRWPVVGKPAVDHPVADRGDRPSWHQRAPDFEIARGGTMVEALGGERPLIDDEAFFVGDREIRLSPDLLPKSVTMLMATS
jgi:hypothetical protein